MGEAERGRARLGLWEVEGGTGPEEAAGGQLRSRPARGVRGRTASPRRLGPEDGLGGVRACVGPPAAGREEAPGGGPGRGPAAPSPSVPSPSPPSASPAGVRPEKAGEPRWEDAEKGPDLGARARGGKRGLPAVGAGEAAGAG